MDYAQHKYGCVFYRVIMNIIP